MTLDVDASWLRLFLTTKARRSAGSALQSRCGVRVGLLACMRRIGDGPCGVGFCPVLLACFQKIC